MGSLRRTGSARHEKIGQRSSSQRRWRVAGQESSSGAAPSGHGSEDHDAGEVQQLGGPGITMASTVESRSMEAHGLVVLFLGDDYGEVRSWFG
jgi:hypothetical protein